MFTLTRARLPCRPPTLRHASTAAPKPPSRRAVRPPARPLPTRSHLTRTNPTLIPASAVTVPNRTPATPQEISQVVNFLESLPDAALPPPPRSPLVLPFSLLGASLLGLAVWMYTYRHTDGPPYHLHPGKFALFRVAAHDNVAWTNRAQTAVLGVEGVFEVPAEERGRLDGFVSSVEIKQPFIQISRHYTPLPILGERDGKRMRLLVKRLEDGEMSRYLFALPQGAEMWVRGEYPEYELPAEREARLLFLVGGTGIAPALQGAQKLLDRADGGKVKILWAVRWPEETGGVLGDLVREMKEKYGERLEIGTWVDCERPLRRGTVEDAVKAWGAKDVCVCGPDGFIGYWAGGKEWVGGEQRQGKLGGVLGELAKEKGDLRVFKL